MTDQTSKKITPAEIRLAVEWLAANANGISLNDWIPRSQTLLNAADAIESLQAELAKERAAYSRSFKAVVEAEWLRDGMQRLRKLVQEGFDANFNEVGECEDDEWLARISAWLDIYGFLAEEISQALPGGQQAVQVSAPTSDSRPDIRRGAAETGLKPE